jgi:hypothetical protein
MLNLLNKLTGKNHHYIYCNPSGLARIIQRPDIIESDEFLTFIRLSLRFESRDDKRTTNQMSFSSAMTLRQPLGLTLGQPMAS